MDGKISFYDSLNVLNNVSIYQKGIKNGVSINYYPNAKVSDSVEYRCGKEFGYRKYYDSVGNRLYGNFYYYGLPFGPESVFKNNKLEKFLFRDFNRKIIAEFNYNSLGEIDTTIQFGMQFSLKPIEYKNKSVLNLFAYLPIVPHTQQSFTIGLTNKDHATREISSVTSHDFMIDTLLAIPPIEWYYYLGCNIKANNELINKFYIEEMIY